MICPVKLHRPIAPPVMAWLIRQELERRRAKLAKALADLVASTAAPGVSARVRAVLEASWARRRRDFERELAELDAAIGGGA